MTTPFTFIHAADLHLDSPFRGLSKAPAVVREALSESTFAALRGLTDAAIAAKADFMVISGDLFDEADRSLKAQLALAKEWERLAEHGVGVFVIHGNHDHLGGKRARLSLPSNVMIFDSSDVQAKPAYSRSGELAAYIYGISYGERAVMRNLALEYKRRPDGPYHIAMLHGNVGGDSNHDSYAPCRLDELVASGFDYWALGHIHKREVLHDSPLIVYPGNTQGRNPRERGAKGCYAVRVASDRSSEMSFVPLGPVLWEDAEIAISGIASEQELLLRATGAVEAVASQYGDRCVMLRLLLTGRGELHARLSEPGIVEALLESLQADSEPAHGQSWVYVYRLEAATGAAVDIEELTGEDSFAGELHRLGHRLESEQEEWRSFAAEAVGDLAGHGRLGRLSRGMRDELPIRWLKEARELTAALMAPADERH